VGWKTHPTGEQMKKILGLYVPIIITLFATDCNKNDQTTYGLMDCQKLEIEASKKMLNKYFNRSLERYSEDKKMIAYMKKSQKAWDSYMDAECSAVYRTIGGTMQGIVGGNCIIDMTKRRTHEIWENYLTYADSTPAILSEPLSK